MFYCNLLSQQVGEIYSLDNPNSTEINLGPVYIGDSLDFRIKYKNNSENTYDIYGVKPTFGIFRYPLETTPDEFLSYRQISPVFPVKVLPKSENEILLQYKADTNLTVFPLGWYNADIIVGFGVPPDTSLALQKQFHYFTKKTNKLIDGYVDKIDFDSVFIFPPVPLKANWRVRSTFIDNLQVSNQELYLITPKVTLDEFLPTFYEINPLFPKKRDVVEWEIGYSPRNKGSDTAEFRLYYQNLQGKQELCKVLLTGTGVQQQLNIVNSNFTFSNDTIYLGSIKSNKNLNLEFDILNSSNFPFNAYNELIQSPTFTDFKYLITQVINSNNKHLKPDSVARIKVNLTVNQSGNFVLKYIIKSDVGSRFKYVPNSANEIVFYIVGNSLEPEIQVNNTTVDFENIYLYYPYCRSTKDTTIFIRNVGNDTLRIEKIEIANQQPMFAFTVRENSLIVPPNEFGKINLNFEPVLPQLFTASLILHNNSNFPTLVIALQGIASTPAIAKLEIDSHRVRPGSLLTIPIKTNQNISFANEFTDTLYYDRSILHYVGYDITNTAVSQPIDLISIQESVEGKLAIHIRKPKRTQFATDSVLIKLKFTTFLGKSSSTTISFKSPKLGNEYCERTLNLIPESIKNGTIVIDSICGLDLKAFPPKMIINSINPIPNLSTININMLLNYAGQISLELYDYFGKCCYSDTEFKTSSLYDQKIEIPYLPQGIYFLKISFDEEIYYQKIHWYNE